MATNDSQFNELTSDVLNSISGGGIIVDEAGPPEKPAGPPELSSDDLNNVAGGGILVDEAKGKIIAHDVIAHDVIAHDIIAHDVTGDDGTVEDE